jgi:tRNA pseudouridine55 synthase
MFVESKDGIMLVDKPAGMTSHDVVNYIRRKLETRRVGHTGILDPNATGLLVMLLGRGTLLSSWLIGMSKRYVARFEFGIATDTYDADGQIIVTADPGNFTRSRFETLLNGYRGEIEQSIPPFSAAKRQGKTFHKLARKGKTFNPGIKVVEITKLEIMDYGWPEVALDITCSSGTYIRSLAHQIGAAIGCGGYLKTLRRLEVGPFRLSDAFSLEEIMKSSSPDENIKPLKEALPDCPVLKIREEYRGAVIGGRPLVKKYFVNDVYRGSGGELSLLLDEDEKVLALARLNMNWRSLEKIGPSQVMGTYVRVIDEGHPRTD